MGNAANGGELVPISFDTTLWNELNKLMAVEYTGINAEAIAENEITMWPNPAQKELNFNVGNSNEAFTVYLYNNKGQLVSEETYKSQMPQFSINISNLTNGMYTLRVTSRHKTVVKKLVINND